MNRTIHDVDAQRARWWRYRSGQQLTLEIGEDFALGGLGRHADDPDLRGAGASQRPRRRCRATRQ
jgi:hypothetical protein